MKLTKNQINKLPFFVKTNVNDCCLKLVISYQHSDRWHFEAYYYRDNGDWSTDFEAIEMLNKEIRVFAKSDLEQLEALNGLELFKVSAEEYAKENGYKENAFENYDPFDEDYGFINSQNNRILL